MSLPTTLPSSTLPPSSSSSHRPIQPPTIQLRGFPSSPPLLSPSTPTHRPASPPPHTAHARATPKHALDLTSHLYSAFLTGSCADTAIRVEKWGRVYHLHRVVLVQAGFFHSLFLGGFSESSRPAPSIKRSKRSSTTADVWGPEEIELIFDDDNITRAAFEICISRLYSPHPTLLPPTTTPNPIPHPPSPTTTSPSHPPTTHPTTPALLLSLLATSIYLGHNALLTEALGLVLGSIGAGTVGRYLGFATGEGRGEEEGEESGAWGLDGVGRVIERRGKKGKGKERAREGRGKGVPGSPTVHPSDRNDSPSSIKVKLEDPLSEDTKSRGPSSPLPASRASSPTSADEDEEDEHHQYFYGFAGDKIGEACACWLARWAGDILEVEEVIAGIKPAVTGGQGRGRSVHGFSALSIQEGKETASSSSKPPNRRSKSISFQPTHPPSTSSQPTHPHPTLACLPNLRIWALGGLPPSWVRAVLSSDVLFIPNEIARYRLAKRVIALRRWGREKERERRGSAGSGVKEEGEWEDGEEEEEGFWEEEEIEEEEREWEELFTSGIHFSHMTFDELSSMANDINPISGNPYVPLPVLQSALWSASDLQAKISSYRSDGTFSDPKPRSTSMLQKQLEVKYEPEGGRDTVVGLAYLTAEIVEEIKGLQARVMSPRRFSGRIGSAGSRVSSGRGSPSFHPSSPLHQVFGGNLTPNTGTMGVFQSPLDRKYWPVPVDATVRIGDAVSQSALFSPSNPLPDMGPQLKGSKDVPVPELRAPLSEKHFFGLGPQMKTGREIEAAYREGGGDEVKDGSMWTRHEPFRFAVEFWGVDGLGEKERAYSTTQFHAGSYFNIYVQTLRKGNKGVQLGIYLHRQSMLEPLPVPSAPVPKSEARPVGGSLNWNASTPAVSTVTAQANNDDLTFRRTMSVTPVGSPPVSTSPGDRPPRESASTSPTSGGKWMKSPPQAPYRDPRNVAKVYFSISCASAMGTALTRFSSGPDVFTVSQSWGWRSSSLRSREYLAGDSTEDGLGPSTDERLDDGVLGWTMDLDADETDNMGGWRKKDLKSLRATVVMGVL